MARAAFTMALAAVLAVVGIAIGLDVRDDGAPRAVWVPPVAAGGGLLVLAVVWVVLAIVLRKSGRGGRAGA